MAVYKWVLSICVESLLGIIWFFLADVGICTRFKSSGYLNSRYRNLKLYYKKFDTKLLSDSEKYWI